MVERFDGLMASGSYLQVRREAEQLLVGGSLAERERAQVLLIVTEACSRLPDYYVAAHWGFKAVEAAREVGDTELLARACFHTGNVLVQIGDTHGAEDRLGEYLCLLPQVPALSTYKGNAHAGLAVIYRQRRQWSTAIDALERALEFFETNSQWPRAVRAHLDLSRCYLTLGAATLATPHIARVQVYLTEYPEADLINELLCIRALLRRIEGDIQGSARLCLEVFAPGRKGVTSAHLGEAAWIMGENALDLGHLSEAEMLANLALDHGADDTLPSLMNLAGGLRRRVAAYAQIGS